MIKQKMHLLKVVDSNCLQSESLRLYFSKSISNYVVLTDYVAVEAYKGETLTSLYKSFEILSEFPRQVIILKSTAKICRMSGRNKGLRKRLIDQDQTRAFSTYCRQLALAKSGDVRIQKGSVFKDYAFLVSGASHGGVQARAG